MFDFSFSELMVVGAVALVVIGPERLPKVAKTVGHLLGRAQRYVSDVKGDIQREFELDELRKMRTEMETAARSFETTVKNNVNEFRSEVDEAGRAIESSYKGLDTSKTPESGGPDIGADDTGAVHPTESPAAVDAATPASVAASEPVPAVAAAPVAADRTEAAAPTHVAGHSLALPARASAAEVMARALRDRTAIGPDRLS